MSNHLLEIDDLHVSFFTPAGEVKAVNGVSYTLDQGKVLGIVGESGSGKSVSVNATMQLLVHPGRVTGGSIHFNGEDVVNMPLKRMQQIRGKDIGMIFQDPMTSLNPVYTVGNQLMETLRRHTNMNRAEARARSIEMLKLVGINNPEQRMKQYPHEYSGGMRQRAMIAMTLLCNPKLLIADEPTTALDVTIQAQILELINRLKKERRLSVIFITHDLGVVANMADRIAIMYAGKIVEYGTADDVFYDPRHPYTWALLSSMPDLETREKLEAIPGTPPDMILPPKGDAFAARNKYAMEIDFEEQPPMFHVSETHMAATWLLHPNAPKVNPPAIVVERIERMKKEQAEREAAEALQNAKKGAAEA